MSATQEMHKRGYAYGTYRYRRFQALHDALSIFFHLPKNQWVSVSQICEFMEWDSTDTSVRRRVRRICEALERVGRVKVQGKGNHGPYCPLYIIRYE